MAIDQFRRAFGLKNRGSEELKTPSEPTPLRDDAKEAESIEAWPRGVAAFDIAIDIRKVPYILEIQGQGAGVRGIMDLEAADVLAGMPAVDDGQLDFWIDASVTAEERAKRLKQLEELKGVATKWRRREFEYVNPDWFDGQKGISRDKRLQPPFIKEENRPETISNGNFERLFLNAEKVVIKPPNMAQGTGIRVFNAAQIKEAREYADNITAKYGGFVAQRFIESRGADMAPPDLKGHAQSLRLVIPFKLNNAGDVEVEIPKFGYQRVARYSGQEAEERTRLRGKRVRSRDAAVVNRSLDAAAVPMSDAEYELALPAALASIRKLADFGKTQPEHLEKIRKTLSDRARVLQEELNRKYRVQIEYPHEDYFSQYDKDFPAKVQKGLEEIKNYLFFLRFLEREFSVISDKLWQSKTMQANHYCRIERIPGTQKASIRLFKWGKGSQDLSFDLKNDRNEYAAGSLKFLLEDFVEKSRGWINKIRGS